MANPSICRSYLRGRCYGDSRRASKRAARRRESVVVNPTRKERLYDFEAHLTARSRVCRKKQVLLPSQPIILVIVRIWRTLVFRRGMLFHQLLDELDGFLELRIMSLAH